MSLCVLCSLCAMSVFITHTHRVSCIFQFEHFHWGVPMSNETFMALASCLEIAQFIHSNRNLLVNGMHWRRLLRMVNETFYKAPALYFWVISLHEKLPSVALPSAEIKSATLKDMASKSPVVADHTTEPERCLTALQCGQWGRFWSVNTDTYTVYIRIQWI